ncbi:MAG: class I SAM-dependent methyltransferase [Candidatus Taylorbacteria bacterium]|nr:class I SAM-dependent methyltransferase [Candidatus Taylorbacteria bacterium]
MITKPSKDYELLDSGEGEKLERFGEVVLARPDPQALWKKNDPTFWKKAGGTFSRDGKGGDWSMKKDTPDKWQIDLAGLKFMIKPTAFKHVGVFPEQALNWKWLEEKIRDASNCVIPVPKGDKHPAGIQCASKTNSIGGHTLDSRFRPSTPPLRSGSDEARRNDTVDSKIDSSIEILNLFGYTGGATLACAKAGAKVVHVDGSKSAIAWARENAELSGLKVKPVRWILEDARSFVKRELKRGRKYAGIIMDPPAFGHGPDNELWKIEDDFLPIIDDCMKLLSDAPLFFIINGYSAGYSAIAYKNNLKPLKERYGGDIEMGELAIQESKTDRLLPCGIFARWSARS